MAEEGNRLFIGNLAWGITDITLREAFDEPQGSVLEAKVIKDRYTERSRGFGFVTYDSPDNANAAIGRMNGREIEGRAVRVDVATSNRK